MSRITAVILARDQAKLTLRSVRSLLRQTDVELELVLVDQGSTDGVADRVVEAVRGRIPLRVIRHDTNQTYAVAANQAVSQTTGELLLFLDNDAELAPGAVPTLAATLDIDDRLAAVGPKMLYPTGQIEEAGLALPLWLVPFGLGTNARGDDHRFNFPRSAFALGSSCLLVRRPAFEAASGFDEGYAWGFEAADLALNFRQRGWTCYYEPRAVCVHAGGATLRQHPELLATARNRERFLARWGVDMLRRVSDYLARLSEDGPRRFLIFGTGESGRHLANTLELGGYEVTGFLTRESGAAMGIYPTWNVTEAPRDLGSRVLIGSPFVREAEETLAGAGLLAGAALPILFE